MLFRFLVAQKRRLGNVIEFAYREPELCVFELIKMKGRHDY